MKAFIRLFAVLVALFSAAPAMAQTWSIVSNFTPSGGPKAATANPGSVGGNWTDLVGNYWSTNSSNQISVSGLTGSGNDWLTRPSSENAVDQKVAILFTVSSSSTSNFGAAMRFNGSTSSQNAYFAGANATSWLINYKIAGTTTVINPSQTFPTLTVGTQYWLIVSVVQTNATTTTISEQITDTSNNVLGSASTTNTVSTLQNASGYYAIVENNAAQPGTQISQLITYTDAAATATAYTLTGPTTGTVGVASSAFTVTPNGVVASNITVTPSDSSGGGTFSPTTVTFTSGTTTAQTFTYTPGSAGSKTISTTNNGSLTNPSSLTYVAVAQATSYTLTGPSTGIVGTPSSNFTVTPNGNPIASITVTPNDSSGGGSFTPGNVVFAPGVTTAQTFTYTAASTGAKTIGTTNNGSLTDPSSLTYTASVSPATALTLTGPSSGTVGVPSTNFTVAANGSLSSSVIVTPADGGNGGTFTPTTITLSSGTTTGTFTYTASAAASVPISITNNGSLTNPSSVTYTATASSTTISPTSSAFSYSPYNWQCYGSRACSSGVSYPATWNIGANFTVVWTSASSSPSATLLLSTTSGMTVSYVLNGVQTDNITAGSINIASASGFVTGGVNTLTVYVQSFSTSSPWGGGARMQVQGLTIDASSSAGVAPARPTPVLWVGDSITCGYLAGSNNGAYYFTESHTYMVMLALTQLGYDTGVSCMGGSGYLTVAGNVPAYYVYGSGGYSEASSRWDKVDSGITLLDSNSHLSAYGGTGTEPAFIIVDYLGNDMTYSANTSYLQSSVQGSVTVLNGAAPNAKILMIYELPVEAPNWCLLGTHTCSSVRQNYINAFFNGVAAANVLKAGVVDLGQNLANLIYDNPSKFLTDSISHPNLWGGGIEAPAYMAAIKAATTVNTIPFRPLFH